MERVEHGKLSRRAFLAAGATVAGSLAMGARPRADDSRNYDFLFPRVRFDCAGADWNFAPGGDTNLLRAFAQTVRCKVKLHENTHDRNPDAGDERHFNAIVDLENLGPKVEYPILFMTGTGSFSLDRKQRKGLGEYLRAGGFILTDDCGSPRREDEFYYCSVTELDAILGPGTARPIPREHEIWRNVFDLTAPELQTWQRSRTGGGTQGVSVPDALGVFIEDRLAGFISNADIHCGWTDPYDSWMKRANRENSIKTGINILMYALSH